VAVRTGSRFKGPTVRGMVTGRERPAGGYELGSWLFMRISGILLLVLAVGHVLIMHVLGGGVERVDFKFVELRWQSPFWRTWDWMMLSLALLHGVNGLRVVILDYVRRPGTRFAMTFFFVVVGVILFALGTIIVFTFNPANFPTT
jgi:succinate dehydrogenase / fumarate reductase membrane anchor subunit